MVVWIWTANNYDDKATEDDGSCDYEDEYEEEHGNHTSVHFYPGWYNEETDNMSVFWVDPDAEGISVLTDIDTDCYDYNTSVLLYVDVWMMQTKNQVKSIHICGKT